ncbi:MAG: hypothetical protein ABR501_12045 [Pyrinomonadaceae bacterium]
MRFAITLLLTAFAAVSVSAQAPTLRIVTEIPNLPSELYYGNIKVKPLRLRPGTNTPITIKDADFFVNQQYVDFLNRFPDQSGFEFWTKTIENCGSDAACIEHNRINTSGAFFLSIEFKETGFLVERLYKSSYGEVERDSTIGGAHKLKVPIVRRSEFLPDMMEIGKGVVVLQPGWEQVLATNKQLFLNAFVQRPRFVAAYPGTMTAEEFVRKLNTNAGNVLSESDIAHLATELSAGRMTRAQVLGAVAEDPDLYLAESNKAFVLMQYLGYLRRDPDTGPDSDYSGYDFWLRKLNAFGGDFHTAEMVKAFLTSSEYLNRF